MIDGDIRTNSYDDGSVDALPGDWPIISVYSGRNIHPERLDEIVARHGGGRWREIR